MKKIILFIAVLANTLSFAQDKCCNVITSNGENVITKNEECAITSDIDTKACLDQDGDGVIDSEDKCPETPGTVNGCPDADKDGVIDSEDQCPNIAGTVKGCPDADKDGVIDSKDKCPNIAGTLNGCPDADKDGILDSEDQCPNVKGTKASHGCPELSKELEATLGKYAKTIQFNTGKTTFKAGISNTLDKIAGVMKDFKGVDFTIDGYTDSVGNAEKNFALSERRAQAVLDYLASHGINKDRLIAKGHGEENPIASNNTKAGRAENRRVTITAKH